MKTRKRLLSLFLSLVLVATSITTFGVQSKAAELSADVAQVSNLSIRDYAKYTGKYLVYFTEVEGATGYNLYLDDTEHKIKTIKSAGSYITVDELEDYSAGSHNLLVTTVTDLGESYAKIAQINVIKNAGTYTDVAQVYIQCDGDPIKADYKAATITVVDEDGGDNKDIIDSLAKIKVRGNSTSSAPKKPWNIKFNKKQSMLGMEKGKKWSLLANAYDKSLMRVNLAYNTALDAGVEYTSHTRFAEIYINGVYNGSYTIAEPVETGDGRVEIGAKDETSDDVLFELGHRPEETDVDYIVTDVLNITLDINSPERGDIDEEDANHDTQVIQRKMQNAKNYLNQFETALKTNNFEQFSQYIDVESFVNFYVVAEYWKIVDFNFSSTRFYLKNGKLYAGPLWDADLSSGNARPSFYPYYYELGDSAYGFHCVGDATWYHWLTQNETFMNLVKERFKSLQYEIQNLYRTDSTETNSMNYVLDHYAQSFYRDTLPKSQNGAGWDLQYDNTDHLGLASTAGWTDYMQPINQLRGWLEKRNEWLCEQWGVDIINDYVDPKDEIISGLSDYDLEVTGLSWANEAGLSELSAADKTSFQIKISNVGTTDIPADVPISSRVTVDGNTHFNAGNYMGGLEAGKSIVVDIPTKWTAVKGGHTFVATVDYLNKFNNELTENNNIRTKRVNIAGGMNTSFTPVTGGYDLVVTDVDWVEETINPNDQVTFKAVVANAGDQDVPAGTTIGVAFYLDGNTRQINWCDNYSGGLRAGETIVLTANGGTNGNAKKQVSEGTHSVTANVDDVNRFRNEVNESNNQNSKGLTVPYASQAFENSDEPDDMTIIDEPETEIPTEIPTEPETEEPVTEIPTEIPTEPETEEPATEIPTEIVTEEPTEEPTIEEYGKYDLVITDVSYSPEDAITGEKVVFSAVVKNIGTRSVPAGTIIGVSFNFPRNGRLTTWSDTYTEGLKPGQSIKLTANGGQEGSTWTATEGRSTVTAYVDDVNRFTEEENENNNQMSLDINISNTRPEPVTEEPTTEIPTEPETEEPTTEAPTEPETEVSTYTVSVDGEVVAEVEEGSEYTLPLTANVGYFGDGKLYTSGGKYTVNKNVSFSAVNLRMSKTPNLKYVKPAGLRFSGKIVCEDEGVFSSGSIVESGLLIAPNDYLSNGSELSMNSGVKYTKTNTSVWVNNVLGSFATSFDGIIVKNYERDFVSRGYMVVDYADGSRATLYSAVSTPTSVSELAYKTFRNKTVYNALSAENQELILEYMGN
jgi:hypothetical protein